MHDARGARGARARSASREPFEHTIYLPDGTLERRRRGRRRDDWTDLDHISPFMQVAVLTTEDGAFSSTTASTTPRCGTRWSRISRRGASCAERARSRCSSRRTSFFARQDARAKARGGDPRRLPRASVHEGGDDGALSQHHRVRARRVWDHRRRPSTISGGSPTSSISRSACSSRRSCRRRFAITSLREGGSYREAWMKHLARPDGHRGEDGDDLAPASSRKG